jgi:hypothetical protein
MIRTLTPPLSAGSLPARTKPVPVRVGLVRKLCAGFVAGILLGGGLTAMEGLRLAEQTESPTPALLAKDFFRPGMGPSMLKATVGSPWSGMEQAAPGLKADRVDTYGILGSGFSSARRDAGAAWGPTAYVAAVSVPPWAFQGLNARVPATPSANQRPLFLGKPGRHGGVFTEPGRHSSQPPRTSRVRP